MTETLSTPTEQLPTIEGSPTLQEGGSEQVQETPQEVLSHLSEQIAARSQVLQHISTQGTSDLSQSQQSLAQLQQELGLTEQRIREILGSIESTWGERFDQVESELSLLEQHRSQLAQQISEASV